MSGNHVNTIDFVAMMGNMIAPIPVKRDVFSFMRRPNIVRGQYESAEGIQGQLYITEIVGQANELDMEKAIDAWVRELHEHVIRYPNANHEIDLLEHCRSVISNTIDATAEAKRPGIFRMAMSYDDPHESIMQSVEVLTNGELRVSIMSGVGMVAEVAWARMWMLAPENEKLYNGVIH